MIVSFRSSPLSSAYTVSPDSSLAVLCDSCDRLGPMSSVGVAWEGLRSARVQGGSVSPESQDGWSANDALIRLPHECFRRRCERGRVRPDVGETLVPLAAVTPNPLIVVAATNVRSLLETIFRVKHASVCKWLATTLQ